MKRRRTTKKGLDTAQRCLAIVLLALFGHAVALDLLHGHASSATASAIHRAAEFSTPHDGPSNEPHSSDGCPACQLQHGFAFLDATPAILYLDGTAPVGLELAELCAAQRIAEDSAPCRAPPAL
jgi:hypothetical protein